MIYILEFQPPFHHAKFYVGYCETNRLEARLEQHKKGSGAKICRAAVLAGVHLHLVTTFPGNRQTERMIKRMKCTPRIVARIRRDGSYGECPF